MLSYKRGFINELDKKLSYCRESTHLTSLCRKVQKALTVNRKVDVPVIASVPLDNALVFGNLSKYRHKDSLGYIFVADSVSLSSTTLL